MTTKQKTTTLRQIVESEYGRPMDEAKPWLGNERYTVKVGGYRDGVDADEAERLVAAGIAAELDEHDAIVRPLIEQKLVECSPDRLGNPRYTLSREAIGLLFKNVK